jgi:hypothetical protein
VDVATLVKQADAYLAASLSSAIVRSYRTGWEQFRSWAEAHGRANMPASPDTVALYLTDLANTKKAATIDSRLATISAAHRAAGHELPTRSARVRLVRRGVRRTLGTAQRAVRPISVANLRKMLDGLGDDMRGRAATAATVLFSSWDSREHCGARNSSA